MRQAYTSFVLTALILLRRLDSERDIADLVRIVRYSKIFISFSICFFFVNELVFCIFAADCANLY